MGAKVTGSGGSTTHVQGDNQGASMRAQGYNWGAHLTVFGICVILGFLKLGDLKI